MNQHTRVNHAGFTMIESLVVLGIIAVLMAIIVVAMSGASETAIQSRSATALRQMANGYSQYTVDNKGQLMPGYTEPGDYPDVQQMPFQLAANVDGTQISQEDAAGYVWRLTPYLGDGYKTVMADYRDEDVLSAMDMELSQSMYGPGSIGADDIGISMRPSFGLNSLTLGGDSHHGGIARLYHPWGNQYGYGQIAATKLSEVVQPSRMILFAATQDSSASIGSFPQTKWGYVELRPPGLGDYNPGQPSDGQPTGVNPWEMPQWWIDANGNIVDAGSGDLRTAGVPVARGSKSNVPLAHLDGSTSLEPVSALANDPWKWMPFGPSKSRR